MAKGRTDLLMKLGILSAFLQLSAFMLGVNFDINTFAKFYLIANLINFVPAMYFLMKLIGGNMLMLLLRVFPIIIATSGMLFLMLFTETWFTNDEINGFLPLTWVFVCNFLFYSLCLFVISKNFRQFLISKLKIYHK